LNIFNKEALEKTDGTIKNGESRDTDYIVHTRHRTKTHKTQKYKATHKTKKMSKTDSAKAQVLGKGE